MTAPTNLGSATKQLQVDEVIKCAEDPIYFILNYLEIQHPDRGRIPFELYEFQKECIQQFNEHKYNVILKSRQLGITTVICAYALWMAMFRRDKNILIMATKLDVGKGLIKKIKIAFDSLPKWMLRVLELTEPDASSVRYLKLTNGSKIEAIPTSADAGRSEAVSLLILDECIDFSSVILIKNKETGEVRLEQIGRLYEDEQYK